MTVTLKDLAKASGVSVGTVSRALNDKKEVSSATSDKIKHLAQTLGYVPNRAGRALSAQKNLSLIGILLPSINSPFFDDIKRGINAAYQEFKDLGLDIALIEKEGWDESEHLQAINELKARGCRALALCTVNSPVIAAKINELTDQGMPVVLINNDIPHTRRLCFVGPDYFNSGQIAAGMLDKCAQGRELKILIVMGLKIHEGHKLRVDGFIHELDTRKVNYQVVKIIEGMDNDITTQQAAMQAFAAFPDINCVYMASGSGVSGLGAAIIANRDKQRFVIACDEIYTTRELVKSGIIDFVICQDPATQGYQAIKKLHECLVRQPLPTSGIPDYIVESQIKIKNHFVR
ncbi:MAG: substrate-binding domain-containing protein [Candidatus Anaerobiospirillum merdipullorum]|uniref:Substrate-binding domain-containing protein n=1 Tax=Candidatus Anaerobiospirillum merdipullorum TaxID=2838450 RepID=A0A9E2KNH1_9GAMM|nr:substrate-binding domain-containing protein [Candidatus Anaerobiospirillum merdipullorum]